MRAPKRGPAPCYEQEAGPSKSEEGHPTAKQEASLQRESMPEVSRECNVASTTAPRGTIEPTRVYSLDEVGELLGLNVPKVRQIIKAGLLTRLTYTRHIRILGEDILVFLRSAKSTGGAA